MAQSPEQTRQDFIDLKELIAGTLEHDGASFILYMWNEKLDLSIGASSADADTGDALLAISRIAKAFKINPDALHEALIETYKTNEEIKP